MVFDTEKLDRFTREFDSPLYVFDQDSFEDNYRRFVRIMTAQYDKYHLSYSYKTNYTPYICRLIRQLGGFAEVVSDMEYQIAKAVGYEDDHILYNGPIKGPLSHEMLLNGGLLNVDNPEELQGIIDLAARNPDARLKIGLRVNIDIGQSFVSRFGIDADSGELPRAIRLIDSTPNLEVQGIHCHVGQSRSVRSWQNRAHRVLEIVDRYFAGKPLKYIDLGSGMFGEMDEGLACQFGTDLPGYEDYAAAIGALFRDYYRGWAYEDKPILFTEPGTTIVNHYVDFVGQVSSIKHIRGKEFVVLNCSKHNLGEICTLKKLPLTVVPGGRPGEPLTDAALVGYTCLEHDVMYRGFQGTLTVGDYVIFGNVGGYSNVSKPPFISPNCAMIAVKGDAAALMKRTETVRDILATYVI